MKQFQFLAGFTLLLLIGLSACKDPVATTITIMQPDNSAKMQGDTMHIHVNFDQMDENIDNVRVKIFKKSDNSAELYNFYNTAYTPDHYEHHADLILDVAGFSTGEWVLEASEWEDNAEVYVESVEFVIQN